MTSRTNRRRFLQTVGASAVAGLAGCSSGDGGDGGDGGTTATTTTSGGGKTTVKLGANYPLSGGLALFGQECVRGVELFVEQFNKQSSSTEIELIKKDAKSSDAGVSNVEAFANQDDADIVIGSFSSSIAQASAQAAARYNLLYWESTGFSPKISEPGYANLWHTNARTTNYGEEGGKIMDTIVAPNLDKQTSELNVAILYENGVFGTSTMEEMERQQSQYGYNIVEKIGYPPFETSDLSSAIEKFKQAEPDVVYHSGYNADTNLFWKQSADLDFYVPAVIGNGTAYVVDGFREAVGDKTAKGILNVDQPHYNSAKSWAPGVADILGMYRDKYDNTPTTQLPCTTYSSMQMMAQVFGEADSFEVDAFAEAALAIDEDFGAFANGWGCSFDEEYHRNQNVKVQATQWQEDTYTDDIYHPDQSGGELDPFAVYPKESAFESIDVKHIPRPDYTQ